MQHCAFSTSGVGFNTCEEGTQAPNDTFNVSVRDCIFQNALGMNDAANQGSIGLMSHGQTDISGCDFTLWHEGIRLSGVGFRVGQCRFEVNATGMRLGIRETNGNWILERCHFTGITGEANGIGIDCQNVINSVFDGIRMTSNAAGEIYTGDCTDGDLHQATYGLYAKLANNSVFNSCSWGGSYCGAAIYVGDFRTVFINVTADNLYGAGGGHTPTPAWQFLSFQDLSTAPFINNYTNCLGYDAVGGNAPLYKTPFINRVRTSTGTTYTMLDIDKGRLLTFNNAATTAVTLPTASTNSVARQMYLFDKDWYTNVSNLGQGFVTITPNIRHSPCATGTTADITLSGEQTIAGVLTSASRVLVKAQTVATQNGIYVSAAGAWARATDGSTGDLIKGTVNISGGTQAGNWKMTAVNPAIGTDDITYATTTDPVTSAIDGKTSINLRQGEGATIWSDGTNYFTTGNSGRAFKNELTPTTLAANQNDYNPTGLNSAFTVRLGGGAADRTITGIQGGRDGRVVRIVNIGATNNLILSNANVLSTDINRFLFTGDWTILPNQVAAIQYDVTSARWRSYIGGP